MADWSSAAPLVGVYAGFDNANLTNFDSAIGRAADAVLTYTGDRSWEDMDPNWAISQTSGRTQLMSIPLFPQTSSLAEVAQGAGDQYFAAYAKTLLANADKVAAPDGSIYVRTAWEMGGEWFPWAIQGEQRPDLFIAAFRRFADAFHTVSDRFEIVWDVNGDRGNVEKFYPGDAYVDVVSQDFYWEPQWRGYDGEKAFETIRDWPYGLQWLEDFADAHGKATAYSEWGGLAAGPGGEGFARKAAEWFNDPEHNVVYHTYWNVHSGNPGLLLDGGQPQVAEAFRDGLGWA